MKKYYINRASLSDGQTIEGNTGEMMCLFSEKDWEGKGNFCGWYGVEFYNNAHIIAYCPGERIAENVKSVDVSFDKVIIWSCIVEKSFEAENDAAAVEEFKRLIKENELSYNY